MRACEPERRLQTSRRASGRAPRRELGRASRAELSRASQVERARGGLRKNQMRAGPERAVHRRNRQVFSAAAAAARRSCSCRIQLTRQGAHSDSLRARRLRNQCARVCVRAGAPDFVCVSRAAVEKPKEQLARERETNVSRPRERASSSLCVCVCVCLV